MNCHLYECRINLYVWGVVTSCFGRLSSLCVTGWVESNACEGRHKVIKVKVHNPHTQYMHFDYSTCMGRAIRVVEMFAFWTSESGTEVWWHQCDDVEVIFWFLAAKSPVIDIWSRNGSKCSNTIISEDIPWKSFTSAFCTQWHAVQSPLKKNRIREYIIARSIYGWDYLTTSAAFIWCWFDYSSEIVSSRVLPPSQWLQSAHVVMEYFHRRCVQWHQAHIFRLW